FMATAAWNPHVHWTIPPLIVSSIVLTWFFLGEEVYSQRFLMSNAFTRYLIPAIGIGALCLAFFLQDARKLSLGVVLCAAALLVTANFLLVAGEDGFGGARKVTSEYLTFVEDARKLPSDSIFIGERPAKTILDAPVVSVYRYEKSDQPAIFTRSVAKLLSQGEHLFGLNNDDATYKSWLKADGRFRLVSSPVPSFYEVILAKPSPTKS
ncbi:MAG: hypothetical protein LC623_00785, partial [Halobacteriales archaeon]|nr:hypothetical protein [Halobacteriales archaeon]